MKRLFLIIQLTLTMILVSSYPALACNPEVCFVNTSDLYSLAPLRQHPDPNAKVLCNFYTGVGFDILSEENCFFAVRIDGIPGLDELPETFFHEEEEQHPHGYIAKADVLTMLWQPLDTFYNLLPKAAVPAAADAMVTLLSAPSPSAAPQASVLPGAEYTLLGKMDGFALVVTNYDDNYIWGYLPEEQVQSDSLSKGFPADFTCERPDYYASAFPFSYALVNPAEDNSMVPLLPAPDKNTTPIAVYHCGTVVQILSTETSFCRVRTVDHEGYIDKALLQLDGEKGKPVLTGISYYRISLTGETVALYSFPDVRALKLGDIDTVDVTILGIAGSWYFVQIPYDYWSGRTFQGFMQPDQRAGQGINTTGSRNYGVLVLPEGMHRLPLYSAPSLNTEVLGQYFSTTQVEILEAVNAPEEDISSGLELIEYSDWRNDGFFRVLADGREGYMQALFVIVLHRSNPSTW